MRLKSALKMGVALAVATPVGSAIAANPNLTTITGVNSVSPMDIGCAYVANWQMSCVPQTAASSTAAGASSVAASVETIEKLDDGAGLRIQPADSDVVPGYNDAMASKSATTIAMAEQNPGGGPSVAPSAQAPEELETITVTARKRTESLQNVPVAVVSISQVQLQNNLASDLGNIGELAPQVIIGVTGTNTGAALAIRGISSSGADSGLDQSVSVSVDGVSLSRGRIVDAGQFDIKQVQILEGPQALFFGKNSPAGVIAIDSVDPTDEFEGYLTAGYEFVAAQKYVEGAVSGPIADNLDARLAFRYSAMDGWIKNNAVPEANPNNPAFPLPGPTQGLTQPMGNQISGRLTLLWQPTSDFSAKFKIMLNHENLNSSTANGDEYCTNGQTVPTSNGIPEPHASCSLNSFSQAEPALPPGEAVNFPYANGGVPYERSSLTLMSLIMNKTFDGMTLTSTTGYYDQPDKGAEDGAQDEYEIIYGTEMERYRMFNQELRLDSDFKGPINFMVGGYYEYFHRRFANVPDLFNIYNVDAQNYVTTDAMTDNDGESYSVFGQVRWTILPSLELDAGARYSHDQKDTTTETSMDNSATGLPLLPDNTPVYSHFTGSNVSPEVTLTWKPDEDQTLYAAFKTGYKSGGIASSDIPTMPFTSATPLFGPEKTHGFEVGYKAYFLSHTLRMDLTGYRYLYEGLQVSSFDPVAVSFEVRNAAEASTYGIEGTFDWLATDHLSFNGNIGWNRARYLSFPDAQCYSDQLPSQGCIGGLTQNLTGQPLVRAPDITFRIGADYQVNVFSNWTTDFSVSDAYTSSYQSETDNSPGGIQPAFWNLDAAVHIGPDDGKYQFSVIGRDLTNSFYRLVTYQQPGGMATQHMADMARPREVALQFSYNF